MLYFVDFKSAENSLQQIICC